MQHVHCRNGRDAMGGSPFRDAYIIIFNWTRPRCSLNGVSRTLREPARRGETADNQTTKISKLIAGFLVAWRKPHKYIMSSITCDVLKVSCPCGSVGRNSGNESPPSTHTHTKERPLEPNQLCEATMDFVAQETEVSSHRILCSL